MLSDWIEAALAREVIGQRRAILALSRAVVRVASGLARSGATQGALLFLGPSGTGKSHICRVLTRVLFGPGRVPCTVDCKQLRPDYEAYQIGLQLRAQAPFLFPAHLAAPPIVVFDRLESAPKEFTRVLLCLLDEGLVPSPDGTLIDFRGSMCLLLSDLCSKEILTATEGRIGFEASHEPDTEEADEEIFRQCFAAAEDFWGAPLMSRVDRLVIFRQLQVDHIRRILDLEVGRLQAGLRASGMDLLLSDSARHFLITKGASNLHYGARRLKQTLAKYLEYPIADLVVSGAIRQGTALHVSRRAQNLHFQPVATSLPTFPGSRPFLPAAV